MTTQRDVARSLTAALHAIDDRARMIDRLADAASLNWQPPEGGWSAGQVFEHLCVANDSYLVLLRSVFPSSSAARSDSSGDAAWRPTIIGRWLARSMESPRKLPAPKIWRPAPDPRPNVIEEFLDRQREIVSLIERSMSSEWRRVRLTSPVSSLIRMNVGDAFTVLVRHEERHLKQIDERLAAYSRSSRLAANSVETI